MTENRVKLYFFGGMDTYGGSTKSYADIVKEIFHADGEKSDGYNAVFNFAEPSVSLHKLREIIMRNIPAYNTDNIKSIAIISLGNCIDQQEGITTIDENHDDIEIMLATAKKVFDHIVVLNYPRYYIENVNTMYDHLDDSLPSPQQDEDEISNMLMSICQNVGVELLEVEDEFEIWCSERMFEDSCTPNKSGQNLIAVQLYTLLEQKFL